MKQSGSNPWQYYTIHRSLFAGIVDYCKRQNIAFPILLYMDGYKAHMGLAINDYCRENGIIPHLLKSNATQVVQPLDNNPYAVIQRIVAIMVMTWMAKNPGDILDKYKKITEIAYKAFERVFAKKEIVIKGCLQIISLDRNDCCQARVLVWSISSLKNLILSHSQTIQL